VANHFNIELTLPSKRRPPKESIWTTGDCCEAAMEVQIIYSIGAADYINVETNLWRAVSCSRGWWVGLRYLDPSVSACLVILVVIRKFSCAPSLNFKQDLRGIHGKKILASKYPAFLRFHF
jgi:hypothetical protein